MDQGHNQNRIAELLNVTKSFISRVASGQRALTIEHLAMLEHALGKSMAALVLDASADTPEKRRITRLLERPADWPSDATLTAQEQAATERLVGDAEDKLDAMIGPEAPKQMAPPRTSARRQVIDLLCRQAGLSKKAAQLAYDAEARFAAANGLAFFSPAQGRRPRRQVALPSGAV